LKDVRLRGVGITGGQLDVDLAVFNPNHYRLDATKLTYTVNMAGDSVHIADGEYASHFTVNEGDTAKVTLPVSFTYAGLGAAGRSLLNTGAVNYHVSGNLTVGSPVGSFNIPYSQTGRFTTTGASR
jgi:LEA14-like dessication related protein